MASEKKVRGKQIQQECHCKYSAHQPKERKHNFTHVLKPQVRSKPGFQKQNENREKISNSNMS